MRKKENSRNKKKTLLFLQTRTPALGKRPGVEIFGTDYPTLDGTGVRDFIHVSDLARAHLAALAYLREGGKSLIANCGYGHGFSVLRVLEAVERVGGTKLNVSNGPRRPGDPASVIADPALIRRSFDWVAEYDDLDFIVRTALSWEESLDRRNATA